MPCRAFKADDGEPTFHGSSLFVYLRHQGKNYYLCCNTHGADDQFIYDRITEHCVRDLPNLPAWWKAEQT
jgi:proline dehydrogenase